MVKVYYKVPALSDTLLALENFDGNTISALKSALKESVKPALQIPISNLDLKIGNSIIGEEILNDSDLNNLFVEARVSISNPIIVIPSFTYLSNCILCYCFSFGLFLGSFFAGVLMGWLEIDLHLEEYSRPFMADLITFLISVVELGCSIYVIWLLIRLSGKQQWGVQLRFTLFGFVASILAEYSLALLRK